MAIARNTGGSAPRRQATTSKAVASGAFQTQARPNTPYRSSAAAPVRRYTSPTPVKRAPAPAPTPAPRRSAPAPTPRQQVVQQRVSNPTPQRQAPAPQPTRTIQPRVAAQPRQPIPQPAVREPSPTQPGRIASNLPTWGGGQLPTGNTQALMPGAAYQQPVQPVIQDIVDPMSSQPPMAQPDPSLLNEPAPLPPTPAPAPTLDGSAEPGVVDPPSEDQYLGGDSTYQDQTSQLRKAYAAYLSNQQMDNGNNEQSYQGSLRDLAARQQQDTVGLNDDFASRGLTNSGLYGQAFSDLQNRYDTNRSGLAQGRQGYQANQASELSDYTDQQNTTTLNAKQEALARRASKYNIA